MKPPHPVILDTNVIIELSKPNPAPSLLKWLAEQNAENLFLTVFSVAELSAGMEYLPTSSKKSKLERWINEYVIPDFSGRILPFDTEAAKIWGRMVADDKKKGRPRPTIDSMIAAIAKTHGFSLATRNESDFDGTGIKVVNPFC